MLLCLPRTVRAGEAEEAAAATRFLVPREDIDDDYQHKIQEPGDKIR